MATVYTSLIVLFPEKDPIKILSLGWPVIHAGYCVNEPHLEYNQKYEKCSPSHKFFNNHILCNLRNNQNVPVTMDWFFSNRCFSEENK